jgi:hypothetical protein
MSRTRLAATALAALAVAVTSALAPSPALAGGTVKITKIHYGQSGTNLNTEYIVFKNVSGSRIQMKGWKIVSKPSSDHQWYVFPKTSVPAGGTVTLYTGSGTKSPGKRYWGASSPRWDDSGDKAVLKNRARTIVDTCRYAGGGTTAYC